MQIGLVDAQGCIRSVKNVPLDQGTVDSPTPLDLGDAMPLEAFLAPVETCKQSISAAIDDLRTSQSSAAASSLDGSGREGQSRRGCGAALQVYLSSEI